MKVTAVNNYRDGGTKQIITDEGTFWIPAPIYKDRLFLYHGGDYFKNTARPCTHNEVRDVMQAMAGLISKLNLSDT